MDKIVFNYQRINEGQRMLDVQLIFCHYLEREFWIKLVDNQLITEVSDEKNPI